MGHHDLYDEAKKAALTWAGRVNSGVTEKVPSVEGACKHYITHQRTAKGDKAANDAEGRFKRLLALRFRDAIADAPLRPMAEVAPLVRREQSIDLDASYPELGTRWKASLLAAC